MYYESDDYAYVQNKQAMQMYKVVSLNESGTNENIHSDLFTSNGDDKMVFRKLPNTDVSDYATVGDLIYFKFLVDIRSGNFEYVPGYARIQSMGNSTVNSNFAWIKLEPVPINDDGPYNISPVAKTGIQFGRLYLKKLAFNDVAPDDADFGPAFLKTLLGASFLGNTVEKLRGINNSLFIEGVSNRAVMNKSWIRLKNPNGHKYGGGSRVKAVVMNDNWKNMTGNAEENLEYGQKYDYTLADGRSSGVAAYEPLIGGDENPWRQPVFYSEKKLMAPDDRFYMEEPFGESFFPGASVGYSRVTVTNLPQKQNLKRHGTGKTVNEFYTAYDFPTITDRTKVDYKRGKTDPYSLSSLFSIDVKDYVTVSQGYSVVLNNMHGMPMCTSVFQEGNPVPISKVTYKYRSKPYGAFSQQLVNDGLTLINPDGTITEGSKASLGVFFDAVYDSREETSETISPSLEVNLDFFYVPPVLTPFVPMIWPGFSSERTQFRSGVFTKVIQQFGILDETIAEEEGSIVTTKNLAYDSQTGDVLVTQTITNFNDNKYTINFPGYWLYKSMGLASSNIGVNLKNVTFNNGLASINNGSEKYLMPGDELKLEKSSPPESQRGWITDVTGNTITVVKKDGSSYTGSGVNTTIIRSGFRNTLKNLMASITMLANPINNLRSNNYSNVLEASAIEYKNGWKTYCECPGRDPNTSRSSNPYINGTRGMWRPSKTYAYLTGRKASDFNSNTNLRKDGVFNSFSPFYRVLNGKWGADKNGWTFASEITEFDPYGKTLEDVDALNRHSSATYGYNQSLTTSVTANARYRDAGADNFEDYGFGNCADNHFRFKQNTLNIVDEAHSGRKSIRVSSTNMATLERQLVPCEYDPCFGLSYQHTGSGTYTITGGKPGVSLNIDYWITSGNPVVNITNSGRNISVTAVGNASASIHVSDPASGCEIIIEVTVP